MGIKRYKNAIRASKASKSYLQFLDKNIDGKVILLESDQGRGSGNELSAFLTCEELHNASSDSKVCISVTSKSKDEIKQFLDEQGVTNVKLVKRSSTEYREILASAGTIITDNALPSYYIKKDGQKVVVLCDNLKAKNLGKSNLDESKNLGLIQKSLLAADKLEASSEAIAAEIRREYMVGRLMSGEARLFYAGDLTRKDICQLTKKIIANEDASNIVVAFENEMKPAAVSFMKEMYDGIDFLQISGEGAQTFAEFINLYLYKKRGWMEGKAFDFYKREGRRLFSGINASEIHFISTELFERIEMILGSGSKTVLHRVPMTFYRRLVDVFLEHPARIVDTFGRFDEIIEYDHNFASQVWDDQICNGVDAQFKSMKLATGGDTIKLNARLEVRTELNETEIQQKLVIGSMTYDKTFEYDAEITEIRSRSEYDVNIKEYSLMAEMPCEDVDGWFIKNLPMIYINAKGCRYKIPIKVSKGGNLLAKNVYNLGNTGYSLEIRKELRHLRFGIKEQKITDSRPEKIKLALAFVCHILTFWNKPIILCEKYCRNYEESASILYERLVDEGYKNVRFVLNRDSMAWDSVGEKYRKQIVPQFSFSHYYNLFAAKSIISSEAIGHSLEKGTASSLFKNFVEDGSKNYVFLQHGVMYMVSLSSEQRSFFKKGKGKGKQRVVASSQIEAKHFTDYTNYEQEDIYVCGLIKFDRSILNEDADKILVMLTWRPWEFVTGMSGMKETGYYKMLQRIVRCVPPYLRDKLIVMPHPLIVDQVKLEPDDEVWRYYVSGKKYDDLLKETKVLITDYSSISYDAFYRGSHVIFDWKEKDECMKEYGSNGKLMLTEELAFGDVCYDMGALTDSIAYNYSSSRQSGVYTLNYRQLVEYHDGDNCGRFIAMAKKDGII